MNTKRRRFKRRLLLFPPDAPLPITLTLRILTEPVSVGVSSPPEADCERPLAECKELSTMAYPEIS